MNYYNEFDPKAAAWLRELIKNKQIPDGVVDERSIEDVKPDEIREFTQCHFFAGIGGWSYALKLAGWPEDRPVWTGSCPCQPFSAAGKGKGTSDERHLWPAFHWLIKECRPKVVFGEQVASKAGIAWLDVVSADLEAEGYAVGQVVLPACSVGAPHIRQRTWFVADANSGRFEQFNKSVRQLSIIDESCAELLGNPDSSGTRWSAGTIHTTKSEPQLKEWNPDRINCDSIKPASTANWNSCDWIYCKDGKHRPVEPGTFPLAYGVSGRVGLLRGYGNAIVPKVAKEVIEAYLDFKKLTGEKPE